jgi:peptidyl-dipeptidase Dcp
MTQQESAAPGIEAAEPGAPELDPANPFAVPSSLPFALPPFADVRLEHYLPAFTAGMAQQRAEVEAIATSAEPPTVENTLEALERSGRVLERTAAVFFNLSGSCGTPELAAVEAQVAPLLAAHHDAVYQDQRLFARVSALHAELGDGGPEERRPEPDPDTGPRSRARVERRRLVQRYHTDFVRSGAQLDHADRERLRALNAELSTLTTTFKNNLLADSNDLAVHVDDPVELAGLSEGEISAAAAAATGRGLAGYLVTLVLPTGQPALESLRDRSVRERLHRAAVSRGIRGNAFDTRATLTRIAQLRAVRAGLLGYPDHAHYVIADQTAGSVDAVLSMFAGLVAPAVSNARTEAAELEQALLADGESGPLQPWDWAYYAAAVRRSRFQLDAAGVRPYLELGRVVQDGIFFAAQSLYGLTFVERTDLQPYATATGTRSIEPSEVQVYEVRDEDGSPRGLFLADWYTRDSKRGGAWMSSFVDQSHLLGRQPVVVINLNVPRPADGEPTLLTLDELRTAFHEFGHVLHGLLSDVRYPRLSGTSVPRDFVEFPSQVNEMWAHWPQVLNRFAVHHRTGEPMPAELVASVQAAQSYGEGFATTEYLAAALLDLEWHRQTADDPAVAVEDVEAFERQAMERHGIRFDLVPPRYRSAYFAHIFSGGYSAGYYSYLWSEVLDADTVDWFTAQGGLTRANGRRFADQLLSRGGAVDPMAAFAAVVGRAPVVEPLLRRRGLVTAG